MLSSRTHRTDDSAAPVTEKVAARRLRRERSSRSVTEISVWQSRPRDHLEQERAARRDRARSERRRAAAPADRRSRASTLVSSASLSASTSERSCPCEACSRARRAAEADLEVVGVRAEPGEAAPLVERRAARASPPRSAARTAVLVAGRLDRRRRSGSASETGSSPCSARKMLAPCAAPAPATSARRRITTRAPVRASSSS